MEYATSNTHRERALDPGEVATLIRAAGMSPTVALREARRRRLDGLPVARALDLLAQHAEGMERRRAEANRRGAAARKTRRFTRAGR
jgi:hypothetical protein